MELNPRGITGLTRILMIVLYVGLGIAAVSSLMSLVHISSGQSILTDEWTAIVEGIKAIIVLVTYVVFGRWLWVTSRNLWDWQVDGLSYSPASGIYWYAVPVAALIMPYNAMRQIWNGSLGATGTYLNESNSTLRLWWAFWLTGNIIANLSVFVFRNDITSPGMALFIALVDIGLYWFASRIVSTIGTAQTQGLAGLENTFA